MHHAYSWRPASFVVRSCEAARRTRLHSRANRSVELSWQMFGLTMLCCGGCLCELCMHCFFAVRVCLRACSSTWNCLAPNTSSTTRPCTWPIHHACTAAWAHASPCVFCILALLSPSCVSHGLKSSSSSLSSLFSFFSPWPSPVPSPTSPHPS